MNKKVWKIINKIAFLIIAIFMIIFSNNHGFEIDELDWTLRVIDGKNLFEILEALALYGYNLPLYYIILKVFYLIAPLNKFVLMLPSIICSLIGIYFIYKISTKLYDEKNGFMSILIVLSSFFIFNQIAWQVRPYGLLFGLSAWSFYAYLNKLENSTKKNYVIYYISITLLLFTHWYGAIVVFCYGITDLILFIKKKIKFSAFLFYLIPFVLIIIWVIYVLQNHIITFSQYWPDTPNIFAIISLLINMFGMHFVYGTHIITVLVAIIVICRKMKKKENLTTTEKILMCIMGYSILIIISVYIYSKFINSKSSLWVDRYFIAILPHVSILVSYCLTQVFVCIKQKSNEIFKVIFMLLLIFVVSAAGAGIFCGYEYPDVDSNLMNYEELSEFLINTEDMYDKDTLVICTYGKWWINYYFEMRGIEPPTNIVCIDPYKFGNTNSENAKIEEFEYVRKDSEYVVEKVDDYSDYKKIYVIIQCRILDEEELGKVIDLEKYDYKIDEELRVVEFIKGG